MRIPCVLAVIFSSTLLLTTSGCASSQSAQDALPEEVRILLTFEVPAPDNTRIDELLIEACNCPPRFIRRYLANALIYQVTLPADQTFAIFSQSLLAKGFPAGLRSVERDSLQHQ